MNFAAFRTWFLGTLAWTFATCVHANIIPPERAALDAIFIQTNGSDWTEHTLWEDPASSECTWYGVTCDATASHVTALILPSNNLGGSLPDISALTALQILDVHQNALSGSVPTLQYLRNIVHVDISSNGFSGSLPSVAGLHALQSLTASNNQLDGNIPPLTDLPNFEYFIAGANQLTGAIPQLDQVPALRYLAVGDNQLTGFIPDFLSVPYLRYVDVSDNFLSGSLPSFAGLSELLYFSAENNQLTGRIPALDDVVELYALDLADNFLSAGIPSLAALGNLVYIDLGGNQLTGAIPALGALHNVQQFEVDGNQLSGALPSLAGLSNLQEIDIHDNSLSGALPFLADLDALESFASDGNGFIGPIPAAPDALVAGTSALCNNAFAPQEDAAWDAATGNTPWFANCNLAIATITASATPSASGAAILIDVSVAARLPTPLGDELTPGGSVIVNSADGTPICYIALQKGGGQCFAALPPGPNALNASYSGDSIFAPVNTSLSAASVAANEYNLNQFGWTGVWSDPAVSGQGFVIEIAPDTRAGHGLFFAGWLTYATSAGGQEAKRWYALSGDVSDTSAATMLDIVALSGGAFDAPPRITAANGRNVVGHATIAFFDCAHGELTYRFNDDDGRVGKVPLHRNDSNIACAPTSGVPNSAYGSYALSGAWYQPATGGQGLLIDVNPTDNLFFAAWYTFSNQASAAGDASSERWYTLQFPSANPADLADATIPIYSAQGGIFNASSVVTTPQVGTAHLQFSSCTHLTLQYAFFPGFNDARSGTLELQRAAPAPAGCQL